MTDMTPGAVTTADLYREVVEARRDLTELVTSHRLNDERIANNARDLADHETRLRILERAWWKIAGGAAVISAVISLATVLIAYHGR